MLRNIVPSWRIATTALTGRSTASPGSSHLAKPEASRMRARPSRMTVTTGRVSCPTRLIAGRKRSSSQTTRWLRIPMSHVERARDVVDCWRPAALLERCLGYQRPSASASRGSMWCSASNARITVAAPSASLCASLHAVTSFVSHAEACWIRSVWNFSRADA